MVLFFDKLILWHIHHSTMARIRNHVKSTDPLFAPLKAVTDSIGAQIRSVWDNPHLTRAEKEKLVHSLGGIPQKKMAELVTKFYSKKEGSGPGETTKLADVIKEFLGTGRPSEVARKIADDVEEHRKVKSTDPLFAPLRAATEIVAAQVRAILTSSDMSREEKINAIKHLEGLPINKMAEIVDRHYTRPIGPGPDEQTPLADSIKSTISPDRPSNVPRKKDR